MSINKYNPTTGELELLAGGSTASNSIFVGTTAEWTAETDKTDFNAALITDAGTVNAVDDTTGDTEVVANKNVVFKGTLTEWNNLTTAQKKTYDEALITNDMDTGEVVNAVTDGDMRAVTSNAVANFLAFEDVSFSINIAAQGRNYSYVNIPSKSGYTAKLVSLKDLAAPTDLAGIMVYSCLNPSTGKCLVIIHNDITSSQTVTGIVTILYVKN